MGVESLLLCRLLNNVLTFRYHRSIRWIGALITFLVFLIRSYLSDLHIINSNISGVISQTIMLLTPFLIAVFLYYNSLFEKIMWSAVYILILGIAEQVIMVILFLILRVSPDQLLNNTNIYILATIFSKILAYFCIELIISKKNHRILIPVSCLKEIWLIITINLVLFIVEIIILYDPDWLGSNLNLFITGMMCAIFTVSILTMVLIYKLSKITQEEIENQLKLQQIEMENKLNKDMTNVVDNLRSLRHDMNNHIGILKGLVHSKQFDDLEKYLEEMTTDIDSANDFIFVENKALSVLLNSKITKAKHLNIDFQSYISVKEIKISDKDMCALLGNIIDNAIEATEKVMDDRYVQLIIKEKDNHCIIQCENTFTEKPIEVNGKFLSSKKDSILHGIGTATVKSIVEKYHGSIDFICDNTFSVEVILPY
jgi:hypothetical protein